MDEVLSKADSVLPSRSLHSNGKKKAKTWVALPTQLLHLGAQH